MNLDRGIMFRPYELIIRKKTEQLNGAKPYVPSQMGNMSGKDGTFIRKESGSGKNVPS